VVTGEGTPRRYGRADLRVRFFCCRCDCGVVKDVSAISLRRGVTVSCGCIRATVTRVCGRALNPQEREQVEEGVRQAGTARAYAAACGVSASTLSDARKGKPVRPGTREKILCTHDSTRAPPSRDAVATLLARIPTTPTPVRVIEAWGCVLDLSRGDVWAALESALARGELARDLGPAGLRWRRVGPPR
jgi:hypothetical protein